MSGLRQAFSEHKALITYVTVGDSSVPATEKLVYQLEKSGADVIELGIPFSDPLADGPVIQASHRRALKNNVSLSSAFALLKKVRRKTNIPICFMLSYNLIVQYGEEKFYLDCQRFGVDGVIVPDLPPEEGNRKEEAKEKEKAKANQIYLIAPTSTDERIKLAAEKSSGFVYLVSVAGITGKRTSVNQDLGALVNKVRKYTRLPIAIGFGISNPTQAAAACRVADGVIVGSAIVDLIAKKKIDQVPKFVASLRKAIDAG